MEFLFVVGVFLVGVFIYVTFHNPFSLKGFKITSDMSDDEIRSELKHVEQWLTHFQSLEDPSDKLMTENVVMSLRQAQLVEESLSRNK